MKPYEIVVEKFSNANFEGISNQALILGIPLYIEEEGIHEGLAHVLVIIETRQHNGKPHFSWVALPKCKETSEIVENRTPVFIEGRMHASFTFNGNSALHQFVVPDKVYKLGDIPNLPTSNDFFMNYTLNNRIILNGQIVSEPKREFIRRANNYVTNFKLAYLDATDKVKTINCTLWDSVNDTKGLKKSEKVQTVSRFNLTRNTESLQIVGNFSKKQREDSRHCTYSLLIQRILRTDLTVEEKAKSLFV